MKSRGQFESVEITVIVASAHEKVCRLGRNGDQPDAVTDAYFPARDYGFLWFREVDGHVACSGLIHSEAIREEQLNSLVEYIATDMLSIEYRIDFQIELVAGGLCIVESGEESLRYRAPLSTIVGCPPL